MSPADGLGRGDLQERRGGLATLTPKQAVHQTRRHDSWELLPTDAAGQVSGNRLRFRGTLWAANHLALASTELGQVQRTDVRDGKHEKG